MNKKSEHFLFVLFYIWFLGTQKNLKIFLNHDLITLHLYQQLTFKKTPVYIVQLYTISK